MKKDNSRRTKEQKNNRLKENVTGIIILIIAIFAMYNMFVTPFTETQNKTHVQDQVEVQTQK